jgi:hypothetical protein
MDLGKNLLIVLACASAGAWGSGCRTTGEQAKMPPGRIAQAESAIQAAEEAGASAKNPSAALHLRMAREEAETAKRYAADNNDRRAETMLIRAVVDADLAKALAVQTTTQLEAQKMRDEVRSMRPATAPAAEPQPQPREVAPPPARSEDDD